MIFQPNSFQRFSSAKVSVVMFLANTVADFVSDRNPRSDAVTEYDPGWSRRTRVAGAGSAIGYPYSDTEPFELVAVFARVNTRWRWFSISNLPKP
jgi:hypothetical protein